MSNWNKSAISTVVGQVLSRHFAELDSAEHIGQVIDFLEFESHRKLAKGTLRRLFPLLNSANADLVTPAQYAVLHKELFECDAEFAIDVLRVITAVNDASAIEHVERLSKGAGCLGKRDARVRLAAMECLRALKGEP